MALVLGPILRRVGEIEATIWVETDSPCEVEVLGFRAPTWEVHGHHYALVCVEGLEAGSEHEYEVALDGETVWPEEGRELPRPTIRTIDPDGPLRLVFGSCRVSVPHDPPYALKKDEDGRGREIDALYAFARRMVRREEAWPHLLLMLGDQVYADEVSPGARDFIRSRRDTTRPPGEEVADFEEYTRLYWDAWGDPALSWLLATVPSAMIFDDHDVHDDWNTSQAWVEEMRRQDWWHERIVGAFMSYWIYQHLGNLTPTELEEDETYRRVRGGGDATAVLRELAVRADRETEGSRWSFCRDLGRTRLVMLDSRAGRVLEPGNRSMVDDGEWSWIESQARGDHDHLLLGTTLPFLLAPGMHFLEAWNERVCDGAWGPRFARVGERIRQGLDLEHWGAFEKSFRRMARLLQAIGSGERGEPPASIVVLSGDVHHAYLAEVAFRRGSGVKSAVYQAVCSPFRNPLNRHERQGIRIGLSKAGELAGRLLARAAGVRDPEIRWRVGHDPWFDNQVATLTIEGRSSKLRVEKASPDEWSDPELDIVFERRLA